MSKVFFWSGYSVALIVALSVSAGIGAGLAWLVSQPLGGAL